MAIAYDTLSQSAEASSANTVSWSHTTSGSDRALFVGAQESGGIGLSGITYNGVAMTEQWDIADAFSFRIAGATLVNPASGTNTVVITWDDVTTGRGVAVSLTGVDQTTPVGTAATATGNSSTISRAVTSAADELVVDCAHMSDFGETMTVGAGQTERMNEQNWFGGFGNSLVSTEPGAASVTMSWTTGGNNPWSTGAIPFKPAGAGGGTVIPVLMRSYRQRRVN